METKAKKPIFKRWWFWALLLIVIAIIVAAAGGGNDSKSSKKAAEGTNYEVLDGTVRTWKNSIGTTWISVAVPVKNTGNDNLYLSSATIDVEDADGKLVKTMDLVSVYPQVLLPGETAYYYDETTLEDMEPTDELVAIPHVAVEKAKVDCIRYEVTELAVKDGEYDGASVTGRVENTTDEAESSVYIVALLFDKNDNLIVQQVDILDNELQPGEKIGFKTTNLGFDVKASDVARYEVYAFPHQYQF
ncbi:MAG: hypothetical protein IJL52_06955 [Clostridia bacterium]|nr:hypothetical protein [Clostridia bacterium]